MQLIRIDIQGFKSFAQPTTVHISPGMTAIVGPNGSGKSNITDAIRWVLGESNIRQLRGHKAEDIIFSGTEKRKPSQATSVTLVFDNRDGALGADMAEVALTRRLYRSGDSEFFINKRPCRLKDIHRLLADTGLGRDSMAIIGQNRVDAILNSKPEERRLILEEVAGITRFKMNKEDALRRIHATERNMERLSDMMATLGEQVADLETKAAQTKRYQSLTQEKRTYDTVLALHDYRTADRLFTRQENESITIHRRLTTLQEEFSHKQQGYEASLGEVEKAQVEKETLDQKFMDLQSQLAQLEGSKISYETSLGQSKHQLDNYQQEAETLEKEQLEVNKQIKTILTNQEEQAKQLTLLQAKYEESEKSYGQLTDRLVAKRQAMEEMEVKALGLREQHAAAMQASQYHQAEIHRLGQTEETILQEIVEVTTDVDKLKEELVGISLEEHLEEKNKLEQSVKTYENGLKQLEQERVALQRQMQWAQSRLEILDAWEIEHEGYGIGTKHVLQAKEPWSPGIRGAIGDLITVPDTYVIAMETALGASLNHIVTDTSQTASAAIEFLKKHKGGRVTFLPLNVISSKPYTTSALQAKGVIGLAKNCITYDEAYEEIMNHLLGRIVVVDTLQHALAIHKQYKYQLRIVTLEGELLQVGGAVTGGTFAKQKASVLSRKEERESVQGTLETYQEQESQLMTRMEKGQALLDEMRRKLEQVHSEVSTAQLAGNRLKALLEVKEESLQRKEHVCSQVQSEIAHHKEALASVSKTIERLTPQVATVDTTAMESLAKEVGDLIQQENAAFEEKRTASMEYEKARLEADHMEQQAQLMTRRLEELTDKGEQLQSQIFLYKQQIAETMPAQLEEMAQKISSIQIEQSQLDEKRQALQQLISQKRRHMKAYESDRDSYEQTVQTEQAKLISLERELSKYELQVEQAQEMLSRLGHNIQSAQEIKLAGNVQDWKEKSAQLSRSIERLGPINPQAIQELEEAAEKMKFYEAQQEDLAAGKQQLEVIISDMDKAMASQLSQVIQVVGKHFQETFSKLFGGGKASIEVADKDNILMSGIDFYIQPPGKKRQQLSLLSGGERALTIIALLFSFLAYRPTPLCVLDEIDAPLDESNVDRFSHYVRSLSQDTQFIIVTHRKRTMEEAEVLQGVTMAEQGISQLLTVTFDDVKENADYGI